MLPVNRRPSPRAPEPLPPQPKRERHLAAVRLSSRKSLVRMVSRVLPARRRPILCSVLGPALPPVEALLRTGGSWAHVDPRRLALAESLCPARFGTFFTRAAGRHVPAPAVNRPTP